MSDDRKSLLWPWIATMTDALLMLYITSVGPVVWLAVNGWVSLESLSMAYQPVFRVYSHSPQAVRNVLFWCWTEGGASDIVLYFLLTTGQIAS